MNTYATTVNTIELSLALGCLVWFFYGPWSRFVIDLARQNLFELRDEIFLHAAQGKLQFSSEAYILLRERLNRMIRYSHHLSLANLIALPQSAMDKPEKQDVLSVIRALPDRDLARKLEKAYVYALLIMLATMFLRSLTLITLFVLLLPLAILAELFKDAGTSNPLVSRVRSAVERDIDLESAVACN